MQHANLNTGYCFTFIYNSYKQVYSALICDGDEKMVKLIEISHAENAYEIIAQEKKEMIDEKLNQLSAANDEEKEDLIKELGSIYAMSLIPKNGMMQKYLYDKKNRKPY